MCQGQRNCQSPLPLTSSLLPSSFLHVTLTPLDGKSQPLWMALPTSSASGVPFLSKLCEEILCHTLLCSDSAIRDM